MGTDTLERKTDQAAVADSQNANDTVKTSSEETRSKAETEARNVKSGSKSGAKADVKSGSRSDSKSGTKSDVKSGSKTGSTGAEKDCIFQRHSEPERNICCAAAKAE